MFERRNCIDILLFWPIFSISCTLLIFDFRFRNEECAKHKGTLQHNEKRIFYAFHFYCCCDLRGTSGLCSVKNVLIIKLKTPKIHLTILLLLLNYLCFKQNLKKNLIFLRRLMLIFILLCSIVAWLMYFSFQFLDILASKSEMYKPEIHLNVSWKMKITN